ncbi:TetR/AcrR family transcriptional regulator [Metabacillus litoralis]|uniref:TetR/AcrR family transcriptional regulator n=1 Tax=Metabacillus litoralis TaxID=152268 RepID=UPI000EF58AE8|nr:TetR/AcrR family transcriptional regulator [Metabacillus litoralis]
MNSQDRIIKASYDLAMQYPVDKITFAKIADAADVHWTTVKRYFGSKDEMKKVLMNDNLDRNGITHQDTRTKILESASVIFAKHGYEGATLDQVVEHAGMTKGAVYWHFSSKANLFYELTNKSLKQLLNGLPESLHAVFHSVEPKEAMKNLLLMQFNDCLDDEKNKQPLLFFEFISNRRESGIKDQLDHSFKHLFHVTSNILEELKQKNLLTKNIDSTSLSIALHALINGLVLMRIISPSSVSLTNIVDDVSKLIWDGIKPDLYP